MLRKLKLALTVIVLLVLVYGAVYTSALISAGSGFAAKNICSGHFISGMPAERIINEALVPAASVFSNVSFAVDESRQWVDAQIFGLFKRRAVFSDGTGCTLLASGNQHLDRKVRPLNGNEPDHETAWPLGHARLETDDRLTPVLDRAFSEPDASNLRNTKAVVVIHRGRLIAEKYADGIDPFTPLIGWSMAKSVTNLLLGILVKDGKLSLHQPAPVSGWRQDSQDRRAAITLDQLLKMSSGLEFNETYAMYSDVTRMLSAEPDAAGFAASKPLFKEPGAHWAYSSGTSNILSGIIRRTVGGTFQDYYEFPQRRLFLPLGIHSAILETDNDGTFIGSSFMYASARDWARLGQFCLQEGYWQGEQLLPEDWIRYSTTPASSNPSRNYGAHFWLNADSGVPGQQRTWPSLPDDTYSMNGFQGQRVIIVPSRELVVVRMGFSRDANRGIEALVGGIIGNLDQ